MSAPNSTKKVPGFSNVYQYYNTAKDKLNKQETQYSVKIRRNGKRIIAKTGFNSAKEAARAGDMALIKEGLKQVNNSFKKL